MMYAIYSDSILRAAGFSPIRREAGRDHDDHADYGFAAGAHKLFNAVERLFGAPR